MTKLLFLVLVVSVMAMACGEEKASPTLQPVYTLEIPLYYLSGDPIYNLEDFLSDALKQSDFQLDDGTVVEVGSITLGFRYKVPEVIDRVEFDKDGETQVVEDVKVYRGEYEYGESTWKEWWTYEIGIQFQHTEIPGATLRDDSAATPPVDWPYKECEPGYKGDMWLDYGKCWEFDSDDPDHPYEWEYE